MLVKRLITFDQFFAQFCGLRALNLRSAIIWEEKFKEKPFFVFPKSYRFTRIISYFHSLVNLCDPDRTLEMDLKYPESLLY